MKIIRSHYYKESQQISRKEFGNLIVILATLAMSLGTYARPNTDPTKLDNGIKQPTIKDGMRLGRIFIFGSSELRKLVSQFGNNVFESKKPIELGQYDQFIIPTIKAAKNIINSLKVNFSQVGYDPYEASYGIKNFVNAENYLNNFPI